MKDEIKVGQIWIGEISKEEKEVLFVGKERVMYRVLSNENEGTRTIEDFTEFHTIKKPEPTLKKLVAWVSVENGMVNDISTEDDTVFCNKDRYIKKELIVKDGSLYVDMGEVEK